MKLALVTPRCEFLLKNAAFADFWSKSREMTAYRRYWSGVGAGLLVVAALTPPDFAIDLVDENREPIDFDGDYDLVAISTMTQQATRAYEIADRFRARGVPVVLGGIHPTVLPEEALGHADAVVAGEAETLWPRFLEDFLAGRGRGLYRTTRRADLKHAPVPRYELLREKGYDVVWVQSTRGCPHDCEFCAASTVFGARCRRKSVSQVVADINSARAALGDVAIGFGDDNMFVDRRHARELLAALAGLKVRWMGQSDISIAQDDELLDLLRASGCRVLFVGFETLSPEGLAGLDRRGWKLRFVERYSDYAQAIQRRGVGLMGAFIVGLDTDDDTVFRRTADFIRANHLYAAQITVPTPLPGTRLRERLAAEGRLLAGDWRNYTVANVNFVPKRMTPERLERGVIETYKELYSTEAYLEKIAYFRSVFRRRHTASP